ncbi:MAG: hypothetical protein Q4E24_16145 [bacterium]|nr:hypothetical protein [bacterium]
MKKLDFTIVNTIEINGSGEDIDFDSLPEEKRKQICIMLQDRVMLPLGFRRKTETVTK